MKFDVIIGNPPYQLNDGSIERNSSLSSALYHLFVDKALELDPNYISMIIPSRWMTRSARGIPDEWINKMINDKRIKEMHDFTNSDNLFAGVGIMGGVNYFLWDKNYSGKCSFYQHKENEVKSKEMYLNTKGSNIVVRDIEAISILDKVESEDKGYIQRKSSNFSHLVSAKNYFTEITATSRILTSNWRDYKESKSNIYNIKYYVSENTNGVPYGWIKESQVPKRRETIPLHKVYIPATGSVSPKVVGTPRYGEPDSVCSQTYLVIGYDNVKHNFTKEECLNIISYIQTKFFRFLVKAKKSTQNAPRGVYQFVPLQDWSKPWTDEELYKKYKLTQEEIDYIEENIAPMSTSDD